MYNVFHLKEYYGFSFEKSCIHEPDVLTKTHPETENKSSHRDMCMTRCIKKYKTMELTSLAGRVGSGKGKKRVT